jgi:hypothetical protein
VTNEKRGRRNDAPTVQGLDRLSAAADAPRRRTGIATVKHSRGDRYRGHVVVEGDGHVTVDGHVLRGHEKARPAIRSFPTHDVTIYWHELVAS